MLPIFLAAAVATVVAIVFARALAGRDRKSAAEFGMTPLYTEICGARIGTRNWSKPFVRVAVYPDFLVVAYSEVIVLRHATVDHVDETRGVLSRGVRVTHHDRDAPERLIIWSSDATRFARLLEHAICQVRDTDRSS
jgi:hypothetical protein